MSYPYIKYIFLIAFTFQSILSFAQNQSLKDKLNHYKSQNDLTNWIYEQLDNANGNPQKDTTLLLNAQKEQWREAKSSDERYAWLNLLSTLGYYQLLDGNILGSINAYEDAFSYFQKHQILEYNIVEYTLKPLSNNYTRLGDYERALYLQQQSINLQQQYQADPNQLASLYCNMAISFRSMSRLPDARKAIRNGLALKPDAATLIMLNNVYADILYDEENYTKAIAIIKKNIALQKATNAETAYWLMSAYNTEGNIYLAINQPNKAQQSFTKAINLLNRFYPYGRKREKANLYTALGKAALANGQASIANTYFHKTLAILNISNLKGEIINANIYGDNKLVDVFMQLANTQLQNGHQEMALNNILLSLLAANKIRNEFAYNKTKERLQVDIKQIVSKGIDLCYQLYQRSKQDKYLHQMLSLAEQSKSRTLLDQIERNHQNTKSYKNDSLIIKKRTLEQAIAYHEKQQLENNTAKADQLAALKFNLSMIDKEIAKKYPQFNITTASELSLSQLPNHRFIEFFIGDKHIYAISIRHKKIEQVIKIDHADRVKAQIIDFVQTYFQQGPNAMLNKPKAYFMAAHHIYQLLIGPLKPNHQEKLTIIPDGVLGYLSFDGLITQPQYLENISKWPFLIKQNDISYAFSIKTLLAKPKPSKSSVFTGIFVTHEQGDKMSLAAIKEEAKLIAEQVKGNFLYNEALTTASFEKWFEQSKVLHIGTHAYLSGANKEPTLDFGKEKMYLFELSAKQHAPSLVVLSACRTADGKLAVGEGIISLSRGFNAIGTMATVASLWNVNDNAGALITADFYKYINKGYMASEALRQAKLNWLNSEKSSSALLLPYYWDSLIYMGKDQQIQLDTPGTFSSWMMVLGIAFATLVLTTLAVKRRKKP